MKGIQPQSTAFVPDTVEILILQEVADNPNCTISNVVLRLLPGHSESTVRSGVRHLLAKRFLDGGKSTREIKLRITANGRVALQCSSI